MNEIIEKILEYVEEKNEKSIIENWAIEENMNNVEDNEEYDAIINELEKKGYDLKYDDKSGYILEKPIN